MASLTKNRIFFLVLVPLFLYVAILPIMPLMEPDEARYADIPSLMNRTGDYVTPHLNHVVYLEKPPLCYWATALAFKIFGENDFSARLFVGLCAWGLILLAYRMGAVFEDEKTGLYSAAILTTFLYQIILGRINILDMPLAFFISLSVWAGYRYFTEDGSPKIRLYLVYFSGGLAFLTKGLIGVVFPFAILVLWLGLSRRWHDMLRLVSPGGIAILLMVCLPWIILAQTANKDFLWFFFVQEHFLRYTTTMHGRQEMFMYYIPVLILGTLPWSAYLWKVLRTDRLRTEPFFEKSDARLLWVWSLFILIFFSVSSSKLIPYVAPIFPPLAVVFGRLFRFHEDHLFKADICSGKSRLYALPVFLQTLIFVIALLLPLMLSGTKWGGKLDYLNLNTWWILITVPILAQLSLLFIPGLVQRRWKKGWFVTIYLSAVLFYASSMIPASHFLAPYKSAYPLVQAIRKLGLEDRTIYQYKSSLYGLGFYQNLRTPIVENIGEMEYGVNLLPPNEKDRYFLSADAFYRLCREKGDLFCVTKYERKLNELKKNVPNVEVLWDNGAYYILHIP